MKKATTLILLATAGLAYSQTIPNAGFESYEAGEAKEYESEIVTGKNLGLKTLTDWKTIGDISIFLDEGEKRPNSSLRIGGAEVDGNNQAATAITIASAGTYTVSFESFTIKGAKEDSVAGVFLGDSDRNILVSELFNEPSDGLVSAQSVRFNVSKEDIERFKGQFVLGFQNAGGKDSRQDVMVDNVSITNVPEPSSTALLGLGALGLLVRRKR